MQLRNKTRSSSKVGYLVKAVSGGFEYAGVGDNPIGVVTNSVPSGAMCEIQTSGEALVYVNRIVAEGNDLRLTIANEGGNAGVAQPVGNASVYTAIGTALQKGSGLIKVALNMASAGVIGGTGGDVPAGGSTGQVLVKNSAVDYDAGWSTFTAIGEASYSNPTPPRTSLVDTPAVAYARYNGTWVDGGLVIDRSGGTGAQLATVNYGERVTFVGDGTYISTNYSYAGTYAGVHEIAISFSPGALGTMSQWYLNADTDSPRQILNDAEIAILGGTYINTGEVVYDSVTDLRWEMTIDVDTTALDGRYYTQTAADATFATQAWVTANFDNYSSWGIVDGVFTRDVISGDSIEFANGGDIQIQYDGYAGGVHTITFTYTGTPGTMDRWYFNTDHVDSPKSIQNNAEVYLIGGTGIDLSEVTYNSSDLRWEMTIASTVTPGYWTQSGSDIYYTTGGVGIGTSTIINDFHIHKVDRPYLKFTSDTTGQLSTDGSLIGFGSAAGELQIRNKEAQDIRFFTNDTTRMTIDGTDGYVGFGTTTPSQLLDISASTGAAIRISSTKDGTWSAGEEYGRLEWYGSDLSGIGAAVRGYIKAVTESTFGSRCNLEFGTSDGTNAATTRMTIDRSGNVIIGGTGTARGILDIVGSSKTIQIDANTVLQGAVSVPNTIKLYDGTDARMDFNTTYATSSLGGFHFTRNGTSAFIIRGDGNVGINTSSPTDKFSILLGANTNRQIDFHNFTAAYTSNGPVIGVSDGGGASYPYNGAGNLIIQPRTSGATTGATGDILFMTGTSPAARLIVRNAGIYVTGAVYATGEVESYDTSDIRLKANHHEISYKRSSQLLDVNVIEFDHILHERHEIGLIAQEIKEIFPEIVKENDQGYLMLDYGRLVAPMLQIIQNQERRIKDLERRFHIY